MTAILGPSIIGLNVVSRGHFHPRDGLNALALVSVHVTALIVLAAKGCAVLQTLWSGHEQKVVL